MTAAVPTCNAPNCQRLTRARNTIPKAVAISTTTLPKSGSSNSSTASTASTAIGRASASAEVLKSAVSNSSPWRLR
jgi:hypothetical protein